MAAEKSPQTFTRHPPPPIIFFSCQQTVIPSLNFEVYGCNDNDIHLCTKGTTSRTSSQVPQIFFATFTLYSKGIYMQQSRNLQNKLAPLRYTSLARNKTQVKCMITNQNKTQLTITRKILRETTAHKDLDHHSSTFMVIFPRGAARLRYPDRLKQSQCGGLDFSPATFF